MFDRYVPIRCAVCNRCVLDRLFNRCAFGGPYSGYGPPAEVDEAVVARTKYGAGPPDSYATKSDAMTIKEVQDWAARLTTF